MNGWILKFLLNFEILTKWIYRFFFTFALFSNFMENEENSGIESESKEFVEPGLEGLKVAELKDRNDQNESWMNLFKKILI